MSRAPQDSIRAEPSAASNRLLAALPTLRPIDGLLLLMTFIWGSNFTIVKLAIREIPVLGFNTLRLMTASAVFLTALAFMRPAGARETGPPGSVAADLLPAITRGEWIWLIGLGLIGHFIYQLLFMGGLARTTVANSSLIMSCTPVAVALMASALGIERIGVMHWAGAALSVAGIYLVMGRGLAVSRASLTGDLMMLGAVVCWAVYTIASRPLLRRHSPLVVTGYSMTFGTIVYAPLGIADLRRLDWVAVSAGAWAALLVSAILALFVAYLIWYTAVQQIGSAKTSIYSNMVPVTAVAIGVLWLGEPLAARTLLGALAILGGVGLTKMGRPWGVTDPATE